MAAGEACAWRLGWAADKVKNESLTRATTMRWHRPTLNSRRPLMQGRTIWWRGMPLQLLPCSHFSPALAENLDAEAARRFIVGKLFAFTCADGSRGVARVYDDGF